MENTERLVDLFTSNWKAVVVFILLLIFVLPEIWKRIEIIKEHFGFVSKEENRFMDLEKRIASLEESAKTFYDNRIHDREVSREIQKDIFNQLTSIVAKLDKKDSLDFKKLRHSIVQAGEIYLEKGFVTVRQLRSLEDMFEEYTTNYNGNSYISTLMVKVRQLKVVGKLNEHGEDIE